MRTTSDTVTALERFADAVGWPLTRKGKLYCLHMPGVEVDGPPIPKSSAKALAIGVSCVRFTEEWPLIQELVAYDPGWSRFREGSAYVVVPKLPKRLVAWEEWELYCLCQPFAPEVS